METPNRTRAEIKATTVNVHVRQLTKMAYVITMIEGQLSIQTIAGLKYVGDQVSFDEVNDLVNNIKAWVVVFAGTPGHAPV